MKTLWPRFLDRIARGSVKIVVLCEISSVNSGLAWKCVSGEKKLFGFPPVLDAISPTKTGFDLRERRWEVGRTSLTFTGDWFRRIMSGFQVYGSRVSLFAGFEDLSESEFYESEFYRGVAGDPRPGDGIVVLPVDPAPSALMDFEVGTSSDILKAAEWSSMHPLSARAKLFSLANVPTDLYDAASFDPTRAEWLNISHWGVGRTGRGNNPSAPAFGLEIKTPTKVLDLDQELGRILPAITAVDARGRLRCIRLSRNTKRVRHIPRDDIVHIDQTGTHKNLANEIALNLGTKEGAEVQGFTRGDINSQNAIRYPGATDPRKVAMRESSPWLNQATRLMPTTLPGPVVPINGTGPWIVRVAGAAARLGFAGACLPVDQRMVGGVVPITQQLNAAAGRYAYLVVEDFGTGKWDLFRATGVTLDWTNRIIDEYGRAWPSRLLYECDQHQLYDSTGDALTFDLSTGAFAYDVTVPYDYTYDRLDWLTNGNTEVRLHLDAKHWALEPGDAISFTHEKPCSMFFGQGVDELTTWLIIDEERDPLGKEPGLWYTAIWLTTAFRTQIPRQQVYLIPKPSEWKDRFRTLIQNSGLKARTSDDASHSFIGSSGNIVNLSGGGVSGGHDENTGRGFDTGLTIDNNMDTFVYRSAIDGHFVIKPVAIGDPAPDTAPDEVPLHFFRVVAGAVTFHLDLRSTRALNGARLVESSVIRDVLANPIAQQALQLSAVEGDSQRIYRGTFRLQTTDGAAHTLAQVPIAVGESAMVTLKLSARRTSGANQNVSYLANRTLRYNAGGGVPDIATVGVVNSLYFESEGAPAWTATVDANTTDETIDVNVTGAAATTVEWFAEVEVVFSLA